MHISHELDLCVYLPSHSKTGVTASVPSTCCYVFMLHVTALTVEMRGVHSLSGPESLRTRSRAQDMSPRCLVPVYPSLQCRVSTARIGSKGQPGRGGLLSTGVMLYPLSLHACIAFSDTGQWADPLGSALCRGFASPALAEVGDLQRSNLRWFDPGIVFSCFSILLPPS